MTLKLEPEHNIKLNLSVSINDFFFLVNKQPPKLNMVFLIENMHQSMCSY